jgi:putative glutamine amidotransferase
MKSQISSAPLILVAPSTQRQGVEFADASISLSNRYSQAILAGGGLPLIAPCTPSTDLAREFVRRSNGLLLTGGDDVQTKLFAKNVSKELEATVSEPEPERDLLELQLIDEAFRQGKPILGICRGHQMLNIALGGTLIIDIPSQLPKALNHRRMDSKCDPVHEIDLEPGSRIASLIGASKISVNTTHHQAVGEVAGLLRATACSADGVIEVLELKDPAQLPFLMSVQFHPERLYDRYPPFLELFRDFVEACGQNKGHT